MLFRSFKVTDFGTNRKLIYNFLLVINTNLPAILSASVNLPLHHKVQKFSSGTGPPGWSRKKGRKVVVVPSILHHFQDTDFDRC